MDVDGDAKLDLLALAGDSEPLLLQTIRNLGGRTFERLDDPPRLRFRDCDADGVLDDLEPDCDGDEVPDVCEIASGAEVDADGNGVPDSCEPDCNQNGAPDECDIAPQLRFRADRAYESGRGCCLVAAGDVDGDGNLDLAAGNAVSLDLVVFRNLGDGSFSRVARFRLSARPTAVVLADLEGDRDPDLFVGQWDAPILLFENSGGQLLAPSEIDPGLRDISGLHVADMDGDGRGDMVLLKGSAVSPFVALLWNEGDGFSAPVKVHESSTIPRTFDLDRDGDIDVVATGPRGSITVFLNNGGVSLEPFSRVSVGEGPTSAVAVDLDGNGDLDVAVGRLHGAAVLWNAGGGSLEPPIAVAGAPHGALLAALDADLDGDVDLAAVGDDGRLVLIENLGGRTFQQHPSETFAKSFVTLSALAPGDYNGDGRMDLALFLEQVGIRILIAGSDGRFVVAGDLECVYGEADLAAGDFDGDGDQDLATSAVGGAGSGGALVRLNDGSGAFSRPVRISDQDSFSISSGDADGDGDIDLVLVDAVSEESVHLLINESGALSRDDDRDGVPDECGIRPTFHRGDPNGDGRLDISDALFEFGFLFLGGPPPGCLESADTNGDGRHDISDGIALLSFLFLDGPPPVYPGPVGLPCGPDTDPPGSPGDLGCALYEPCL
ncbi:MAG: FG-GAP repeat domain-containing protein [Planctomycetota bacterium]